MYVLKKLVDSHVDMECAILKQEMYKHNELFESKRYDRPKENIIFFLEKIKYNKRLVDDDAVIIWVVHVVLVILLQQ